MENINDGFLKKIARDFSSRNSNPAKALFVFPSLRSINGFKEELRKIKYRGLIPKCLSITEFIDWLSDVQSTDRLSQKVILWELFRSLHPEISEEFLDYKLDRLIADANELELFELDISKAFKNAAEYYKLDVLSKDETEISRYKQHILVCEALPSLWDKLQIALAEKSQSGSADRIELAIQNHQKLKGFDPIGIVGFGLLNPKELSLYRAIKENHKLNFYWNVHRWYVEDKFNEAGRFYRDLPETFVNSEHDLREFSNPEISYSASSSNVAAVQAVLGNVLESIHQDPKTYKYAIILGDENISGTLLYFLSKNQELYNLSSALPQDVSDLFSKLHEKMRRAFKEDLDVDLRIAKFEKYLNQAKDDTSLMGKRINEDLIETIHAALKTLKREGHKCKFVFNRWNEFFSFLNSFQINIKGDPAARIQIFGLLEARNMQFDRLYFLNFNEGSFQGKSSFDSFIPFSQRLQLGLPSPSEKESVFSYYFYSLLSSAKSAYLTYIDSNLGFSSGESSRLLQQMLYSEQFPNVKELLIKDQINTSANDLIRKDAKFDKEFNGFLEKGISASSINLFIRDPMEFYYRYLWRVKEVREEDSDQDSSLVGTAIHYFLEQLYLPYVNEILSHDVISKIEAHWKIDGDKYLKKFQDKESAILPEHLVKHMNSVILNYLNWDKESLKSNGAVHLMGLELQLEKELKTENFSLRLKGTIDRLEKQGNVLRVIDYKTGKVEAKNLKLKTGEKKNLLLSENSADKIRQLLVYNALLNEIALNQGCIETELCIDALLSSKPKRYTFDNQVNEEVLTTEFFQGFLENILHSIHEGTEAFHSSVLHS